ncbi:ATP-binding cassette domain-containing protein [Kribbella sp. NBC_01245]|uniref:ABC transporter ATP-binding protein n=1 Tax=Kribbella sp. NBC_01245 TaxID=2903578 RepID=UPI002E2E212F|nr:ATP-binding cassette domain-containing protein [Kribbella sp. NBC_01245]
MTLLEATNLHLVAGGRSIVDRVSFALAAGEAVAITGSSGSGKTSLAMAILGHLRDGVRHADGSLLVDGIASLPTPPPGLRGGLIGYVGQDPGSSLNPYARVGATLLQATGRRVARPARAGVVAALLARVGLPSDLSTRYPHQLSGGQQQRVVMAAALARDAKLLVLDEPTTALDLVAKAEVVAELRRLSDEGVALLWITHDLGSVRTVVDRVIVMDAGRVVEDRPVADVLDRPVSSAAKHLLVSACTTASTGVTGPPVLRASGVVAAYGRHTPVLADVDLDVRAGECLAVLGASGVGKSTLARTLAGLHPPRAGELVLKGSALAWDVHRRTRAERAAVQLVGQNPAEALHPRQTVRTALVRPLVRLRGLPAAEHAGEVKLLLDAVRLPFELADRLPGELSGGQRQRVALARALAARPEVIVCDEITSALDTVTESDVLRMLTELRTELGLAIVLITHDPDVAATVSNRLLVLSAGRVTRTGPTSELLPPSESPEARVRHLLTTT